MVLETLGAMEAAISFYTRYGFARTGSRQIGQGAKAFELVSMRMCIDAQSDAPVAAAVLKCTEPRAADPSGPNCIGAPSPPATADRKKRHQKAQKAHEAHPPPQATAPSEPSRPGTPSWATGSSVRLTHHATGMSSVFLVETDKVGPSGALARVRMPDLLPSCVAPRFPFFFFFFFPRWLTVW